jgi:hypothetical protein
MQAPHKAMTPRLVDSNVRERNVATDFRDLKAWIFKGSLPTHV